MTTVRTARGESKCIILVTRRQVILTLSIFCFSFIFPLCIRATFCPARLPGHFLSICLPVTGLTVCLDALDYSCPVMGFSISLPYKVGLCKIPISPYPQLVKVTLNGNTAIWWYNSFQFCNICKIPESALCPIIWSLVKMFKSTGPAAALMVHCWCLGFRWILWWW